jgi:hypothetical protein
LSALKYFGKQLGDDLKGNQSLTLVQDLAMIFEKLAPQMNTVSQSFAPFSQKT